MKEERPWGSFEVLHEGSGFKVKILEVSEGKRLSYQSHERREERWVIAEGTAEIIIDDKVSRGHPGDVIYIEKGQKHRLSNPGKIPLKIIEVQLGDYLEEDDIIRYTDDFGRT